MVFKLIKFILVGFTGLFIDFGLTFFCKEKLNLNKYISNSIGFVLAALSNYFINRILIIFIGYLIKKRSQTKKLQFKILFMVLEYQSNKPKNYRQRD